MTDSVVITGIGIISPIGRGEDAFWNALTLGKSAAAQITGFDTTDLPRCVACQVREAIDVDADIGRASKLAVAASRDAISSANLDVTTLTPDRLGVIVGTTMGETEFIEQRLQTDSANWLNKEHVQRIDTGRPGCISKHVQQDIYKVGSKHGLSRGPSMDLYGACAAGNMAINVAKRRLLDGSCDAVLAGGADGFSQLAFIGFMRARVMSEGICRPFDQRRDGLLVGEGAALFVLERRSTAIARGATIRAIVSGTGVCCENYHPTRPHPEGDGLTRATKLALADARLDPNKIDYVCAHGTGTPQNDAIEVKVLERCFTQGVPFSSVKSLTGHTMGAAAAVEAACCIISLERQTLIPTWHLEQALEPCNAHPLIGAPQSAKLTHVVNNSAGFGGYNASLVLSAA